MPHPIRVAYRQSVHALAIDFPGADRDASSRCVRLDRDRVPDFDHDGRLISVEPLNVSHGVDLDELPEPEVLRSALDLVGPEHPS